MRVELLYHIYQELPMILRQFLHTDPVVATSYVFG
jgi:hypothetical protein